MGNNAHIYGLRIAFARGGGKIPTPITRVVADAYQGTIDGGGTNVGLSIGDPVKLVSDGSVALANTTNSTYGVIVSVLPYWNATLGRMEFSDYIPGATTSSGVFERRTRVQVVPISDAIWELDVDEATTATTEAAYEAFIGENVTMVCPGDTTIAGRYKADPRIDISTHATTNTLIWRIVGVSPQQQDFAGTNVKLLIACNIPQDNFAASATGV